MTALLLSPHNDDAALFAAFTCYAEKPHVVTVLRSVVQEARGTGITAETREAEDHAAMEILGCPWQQWVPFGDDERWPDAPSGLFWDSIRDLFGDLDRDLTPEGVYAPLPEDGGHPQHNRVGELASEVFGDRCRFYATYTTTGKSTAAALVEPAPGAVSAKLAALACYRTQSDLENCRPHFLRGLEEYLTP